MAGEQKEQLAEGTLLSHLVERGGVDVTVLPQPAQNAEEPARQSPPREVQLGQVLRLQQREGLERAIRRVAGRLAGLSLAPSPGPLTRPGPR